MSGYCMAPWASRCSCWKRTAGSSPRRSSATAPCASAALAAAFFQPDMPDVITIEEIENGIHSSRARLLLELLRSQAEAARTQVVATTHSAAVLDWLGEEDYRTTFVCKRDAETGETRICALTGRAAFH